MPRPLGTRRNDILYLRTALSFSLLEIIFISGRARLAREKVSVGSMYYLVRRGWVMLEYECIFVFIFETTVRTLTFKFEWLDCNGENATWVGGFDWDNC